MTVLSRDCRVTIFGGSGFVGRYIVEKLARRGARILVAGRSPEKAHFLKALGDPGQIVAVKASLRDEDSVRAVIQGADIVINCVGILYQSGSQKFDSLQAEGPAIIARAASEAGVKRLIQISAIGASPDSPALYARTKAQGEQAALQGHGGTTILRPSIIFGTEDQFFNLFAGMGRIAPVLPLIGGGKTKFQPVWVGDVAEAVIRALDQPETAQKIYELGGPEIMTFRQVLEFIRKETGQCFGLLSLPFAIARLEATFLQMLPVPPLTVDQVRMLERDNIVAPDALTLADLGIDQPAAVPAIVPQYLWQYRKGGRWSRAGS